MNESALRVAARYRSAARMPLDEATIEKFRKDSLLLLKNVGRLNRSRERYAIWRRAVLGWAERFFQLGNQIRTQLESRIREDERKESWKQTLNLDWARHYISDKGMKAFWDFQREWRDLPNLPKNSASTREEHLARYVESDRERVAQGRDPIYGDLAEMNQYLDESIAKGYVKTVESEEARLWDELEVELKKWDARVKAKARLAWKYLGELAAWTERGGTHGGGETPLLLVEPTVENVTLGGFAVQLVGFAESDPSTQKYLESFKAGLNLYRDRAVHVFPWLIRYQLPLVVELEGREKGRDAAATYERTHIVIKFWGFASDPRALAHTLAHEMGHHVWKVLLSNDQKETWEAFIQGDYRELDLREVMKQMKSSETIFEFGTRLEFEDPILHLQIESLYHNPAYNAYGIFSAYNVREHLEEGKDPIVHVPANPITGYASKNREEAFCEALGKFVAYGPRSLPKPVVWILRRILPNLRTARRDL